MTPSDLICVEKITSRRYGLGSDQIDVGLPHYVAMDRKPENGCEIRDAACGRNGIILRLEIVTAIDETREKGFEDAIQHGAAVLRIFIGPWIRTKRQCVYIRTFRLKILLRCWAALEFDSYDRKK